MRDGRLSKVEAATGRLTPFIDAKVLAAGLSKIPSLDAQTAQSIAGRNNFDMSPDHRGFLFEHGEDLYYASFDGSKAVRLTNHPGREQWPKLSPDGKAVAFVRDYDLYVVDIASQTELRLSIGGRDDLRHAHADWVYFEEIFNRRWPAFWWSPDSKRLAFLEFDSSTEPLHTVLDDSVSPRRVEQTRYPRSGEPNPKVRLGIVSSSGGAISWADLADYSPESSLISEVGWFDGSSAYCYVQDRAQTWLDLVKVTPGADKGVTKRLFRDSTKAWIESPGPLHVLDDKSFLWLSERDGWKHLYQYNSDGTLRSRLTFGPWEIRALENVGSKNGWVYFTATRDNPVATNLYRVKPGGGPFVERLTQGGGSHDVTMSPDGGLYLASWSDIHTPSRLRLHGADGHLIRTIDSNPSHELKQLRFGPRAPANSHQGRFPARGRVDLTSRPRPQQEVPSVVHDLCRPAYSDRFRFVDGRPDAGSGDGSRGLRCLSDGSAKCQRQGGDRGVGGLQASGRPGARGHQDGDQLAQAEALYRRLANRHGRP